MSYTVPASIPAGCSLLRPIASSCVSHCPAGAPSSPSAVRKLLPPRTTPLLSLLLLRLSAPLLSIVHVARAQPQIASQQRHLPQNRRRNSRKPPKARKERSAADNANIPEGLLYHTKRAPTTQGPQKAPH